MENRMSKVHLDALCPKCGNDIGVDARQVEGQWQIVWMDENGALHVHQPGEGRKNE